MCYNMEKIDFGYSPKNIPLPTEAEYRCLLIQKAKKFIPNLSWRVFFFLKPQERLEYKETYGLLTEKPPPCMTDLAEFESKLTNLIKSVKFKNNRRGGPEFQARLKKDLQNIKAESRIHMEADKTNNKYLIEVPEYETLLLNNITSSYCKAENNLESEISQKEARVANELEIVNRAEVQAKKQAYVTIKDHKINFRQNKPCRLLNSNKSELGRAAKRILERVNSGVRQQTGLTQWQNTQQVIQWFKKRDTTVNLTFTVFDILNFTPA